MRATAFFESQLTLNSVAFCAYEYALTFSEEIDYIWRRKFSIVSLLFVISRYCVMCYNVLYIVKLALPWSQAFYRYAVDHEVSNFRTLLSIQRFDRPTLQLLSDNSQYHDHSLIRSRSCRIAVILTGVMYAVVYFAMTCKQTAHPYRFVIRTLTLYAVFAAIRTHALWNRDYRVLVCVLIAGLGYPISDIVGATIR